MTVSTDGQLCFGYLIDEDTVMPWDADPWDGDADDWWFEAILGFKPSKQIYDEHGDYLDGVQPVDVDQYYAERRDFRAGHPSLPVELVNVCSVDYPQWIIAVPSTCMSCSRGYPERFVPSELAVLPEQIEALEEFLTTHAIDHDGGPSWYLSSYWG